MVGTGRGASKGILIKSAEALENLHSVKYFLTDKTGTLTEGRPRLTDIVTEECDESYLLKVAYSAELLSSHPLALAICEGATAAGIERSDALAAEDFCSLLGKGISVRLTENGNSALCVIGTPALLFENGIAMPPAAETRMLSLEEDGKTVVAVGYCGRFLGLLAIADGIRPDSKQAIEELKKMGITPVMLTGDNQRSALAVGRECGIDEVRSRLLPEDKERIIREYSEKGRTAMVGDGINDAPALASADIGIAIGAGTEVAIDCADVVLSKNSLTDAVSAISLSRATITVIKQNLFWALIYNAICIPIAAGALYPLFEISLSPMIASAAMSFSSVCVVLNSIRLRNKKIYIYKSQEDSDMFGKTKTVSFTVE
jgi:heavy metal translocating P-type ATPase